MVTNELHGYVSLLALVFIAIHVVAVAVDPFTTVRSRRELLVPFTSHYRPLWMGLGIVALYLLLAVWVTTKLRDRIGYTLWRRIHVLAFAVYAAATLHGLGTGSDTRTRVGVSALYASSVALVGALLAIRLLAPAGSDRSAASDALAALAGLGLVAAVAWTVTGPLAPRWSSGRRQTARRGRAAVSPRRRGTPSRRRRSPPRRPTTVHGSLRRPGHRSSSRSTRADGSPSGSTARSRARRRDHLEILLHGVPARRTAE